MTDDQAFVIDAAVRVPGERIAISGRFTSDRANFNIGDQVEIRDNFGHISKHEIVGIALGQSVERAFDPLHIFLISPEPSLSSRELHGLHGRIIRA
ncbi:MAG: hypothetical protein KDA93_13450 [Planctomycetaceae bacterium]|nr:hypothetical protein [Planctomycetaceae bacterium]